MSYQIDHDIARHNFTKIDQILVNLGLTENERKQINEYLAVILHLQNVEFEKDNEVTELTKNHIAIAAQLMHKTPGELEEVIRYKKIVVAGTSIL